MKLAEFDRIPKFLRDTLREDYEGSIDGVRWVASNHVAFAVAGGTWSVLPGKVGRALELVRNDGRKPVGAYHVRATVCGSLPCGDATGSEFSTAGHYVVQWPGGASIALYYMAVVHHLFGSVEWRAAGELDPVTAHVEGSIVALVMPVRYDASDITLWSVSAAGQGARP